ncbi:MAG: hypothetical protein ACI83O_000101 [Patescibacteria group bacterium]|jgi:hypothetical protein
MLGNKRGVSEIIGYVLLIGITVGISVMVFNFLMFYVPTEEVASCPDTVSLSIRNISCNSVAYTISFDVKNTGFFSVDGFLARVNDKPLATQGIFSIGEQRREVVPSATESFTIDYSGAYVGTFSPILTILELQPFVTDSGDDIFCNPPVRVKVSC